MEHLNRSANLIIVPSSGTSINQGSRYGQTNK